MQREVDEGPGPIASALEETRGAVMSEGSGEWDEGLEEALARIHSLGDRWKVIQVALITDDCI